MKSRAAIVGGIGVVVAALIYWFGFRDRAEPKPAAVATANAPAQPAPTKADKPAEPEQRLRGTPRLTFETDPDGPLRLEGQVLDEDDHPVEGAKVHISTRPGRTAVTDADGSFSFDKLLGRSYSLRARAGDKVGGPITTKLDANAEPVVLRLRPGVAVTVQVSDTVTKKPISGAAVTLLDGSEESDLTETTGADGKVVFRGVDDGWTSVMGSAPGYGRATANKLISKGDKGATIELALKTGAALSGRVVDDNGAGLAGARVWAADVSNAWENMGSERSAVTSGADGAFTIPAVSAGSYVLRAQNETHAPAVTAPISVTGEAPTSGVQVVMKAAATLAGIVVGVDQKPVPYASVRLSSREWSNDMVHRQAAADDQGRFEMRALPRTALKVRAESEDAASKAVDVDLATNPVKKDLTLVLDQSGTITGIVVDGAGEPIAEAEVNAYPDFLAEGKTAEDFVLAQGAAATTDGGGRFALRGLEAGKFRLWASRSSGGETARGQREGVIASTGDKDVKLVLPAPGGIKGKVQLENNDPPTLAMVSTDWEHRVTVRDGEFALTELVPGKYDLRITGSDFADKIVRDIEITAGKVTDAGTITVRPGRKIGGRVVDGNGQGIEGARVLFGKQLFGDGQRTGAANEDDAAQFGQRLTTTDRNGAFVISGVARGTAVIVAEHADRGRSLAQRIPGGTEDVTGVTLTLKSFGSIAGKVTRKGQPVASAMVSVAPVGSTGQASFVQAGADGSFVIDKVAEGPTGLSAMKNGMMSMSGGARTVTVIAGQRVDGSIDLPAGNTSLTVEISPKPGARVNAAQVFLFYGAVAITNGQELMDVFTASRGVESSLGTTEMAMSGAAGMLFWLGGAQQPTFKELIPATYSACVIPVTGSIMDQQLMQRIMRNLDKLEVICQTTTVAAAPAEQRIAVAVPTMRELPDDE